MTSELTSAARKIRSGPGHSLLNSWLSDQI
jgi:hypothetical protein